MYVVCCKVSCLVTEACVSTCKCNHYEISPGSTESKHVVLSLMVEFLVLAWVTKLKVAVAY